MFLTGHLGTSYLLHRLGGVNLQFAMAASIGPDLVDKGLKICGLLATGRHVGHSLWALGMTTAVVFIWWGTGKGMAWLAGYAGHLLVDLPFSWAMPWLFPFEWGTWHNSVETGYLNLSAGQVEGDLAISLIALATVGHKRGWFPFRKNVLERTKQ